MREKGDGSLTSPSRRSGPIRALNTADNPHDDTAAIVKVFEFLAEMQRKWPVLDRVLPNQKREPPTRDGRSYRPEDNYIIYLPDGVYDVSDTLACVEDPEIYHRLGMVFLRVWGQSCQRTVIRLKDNSPKFAHGTIRPVLSFNKSNGTAAETVNSLANLTIDTGSGNPGAIGVVYVAANRGDVRNLLIRSGDGQGAAGIYLPYGAVIGCFHDITIEGFDRGVHAVASAGVNPVFEHLALRNQRVAAIEVEGAYCFLRRVVSLNCVPAVRLTGDGSVQVVDSRFTNPGGGEPAAAAIDAGSRGFLFARDIHAEGYHAAIAREGKPVLTDSRITEWCSHPAMTLFDDAPRSSMNLQVRNAPPVPRFDPQTEWASPEAYPTAAQRGRRHPRNPGRLRCRQAVCVLSTAPFTISHRPSAFPAHVRRIDFLFATALKDGVFEVAEKSAAPLLIENVGIKGTVHVRLRQPRPLVLRCGELDFTSDLPDGASAGVPRKRAWRRRPILSRRPVDLARALNSENANMLNWRVSGGLLWSAGHKSERRNAAYWVEHGGIVESLGGYAVVYGGSQQPRIVNDNSHVSVIGAVSFGQQPWPLQVRELRGKAERVIQQSELRRRGGGYLLPFYAGYDPQKLPPHDTTAPAAVKDLKAAKTEDAVVLSWDECREPDFGGYRLYRQDAAEKPFVLIATIGETIFTDRRPPAGAVYKVAASDTAGNETATTVSW